MRFATLPIVLLIALANLAVWAVFNPPALERPWRGVVRGVSYSPFHGDTDPTDGDAARRSDMERDMAQLAGRVRDVRMYSVRKGLEDLPAIAGRHGLGVIAGAWVDRRPVASELEVAALIDVASREPAVRRALVGNEALLRGDVSVEQLREYLRRVRGAVDVPVSTAEPWHIWLAHPELAEDVDFIAAHVLPYWEGVSVDAAVDHLVQRWHELHAAFPGKEIVLTEVGWPSAGRRNDDAEPGVVNAARFVRRFLNVADELNIQYIVMEAYDQPWKGGLEGSAGAHWGLFDADGEAKFPLVGPLQEVPNWPTLYGLATALAFLPLLWFLGRFRDLQFTGRVFFGVILQIVASMGVWAVFEVHGYAVTLTAQLLATAMLLAQGLLALGLLVDGFEMTEILWRPRRRRFAPVHAAEPRRWPFVSLHIAIANEPPDLVRRTLQGLARLDYPEFEVIVVDNNTKDPALWQPVEAACEELGPRFRFFHFDTLAGFKAGAVNVALRETDPRATVVGVLDSDYVVNRDWLRRVVPYFDRQAVGFVQAPQDNRAWEGDLFQEWINWEYAGFFHLGMVHRNERDAIIQHGTMTLVRKSALEELGGWAEWCICEDAELGLRLLRAGWESVYVDHVFGKGITPPHFAGYRRQRFRWAYGAVQILKRHWRALLPWSHDLTPGQRYHFATGWLPWFTDALHVLFTLTGLVWTAGLVIWPDAFEFPLQVFLLPTPLIFIFKVARSFWLYEAKVPCTRRQRLGAAIAGMALTFTVGKAILAGLFTRRLPFQRTPKFNDRTAFVQGLLMARDELIVLSLLWLAAAAVTARFGLDDPDAVIWAIVLGVHSLPYAAAVALSLVTVLPALRYGHLADDVLAAIAEDPDLAPAPETARPTTAAAPPRRARH